VVGHEFRYYDSEIEEQIGQKGTQIG